MMTLIPTPHMELVHTRQIPRRLQGFKIRMTTTLKRRRRIVTRMEVPQGNRLGSTVPHWHHTMTPFNGRRAQQLRLRFTHSLRLNNTSNRRRRRSTMQCPCPARVVTPQLAQLHLQLLRARVDPVSPIRQRCQLWERLYTKIAPQATKPVHRNLLVFGERNDKLDYWTFYALLRMCNSLFTTRLDAFVSPLLYDAPLNSVQVVS